MRAVSIPVAIVVTITAVVWPRHAPAFCRTMSCPLPPGFAPNTSDCVPPPGSPALGAFPDFASYCAALNPPSKVLPIWWRNACISFDVQKDASRQVTYDTAVSIVTNAFGKWTSRTCPADSKGDTRVSIDARNFGPVDCSQIGYNPYGGPNQHVIVFCDDQFPCDSTNTEATARSAGNTLGLTTVTFDADTGEIYDADTEINGTVHLSVADPPAPGAYDLDSIITHEMGHFLGLAHSGLSSATMYFQYTPGSTSMRMLTSDDVAGICSIYPPDGTRSVDPSVNVSGSIAQGPCDGTPRHGFTTQCPQQPNGGCACALALGRDGKRRWALAMVVGLGWLAVLRSRRRAAES